MFRRRKLGFAGSRKKLVKKLNLCYKIRSLELNRFKLRFYLQLKRFGGKIMTANDHAKILGIIFLIFGGIGVLAVIGILIFLLGMGGLSLFSANGSDAIPIIVVFGIFAVVTLISLIFIIPQLIAGWNLLKGNGRGKIWLIISAIINVLNFPIGTAIGIYAFWFTFGEEGKRCFRN